VHEIEPELVGGDERSRLLNVRAEHLVQGGMQQVCRGVIAPRGVTKGRIHSRNDRFAPPENPAGDADLVWSGHGRGPANHPFKRGGGSRRLRHDLSLIVDLAAGFDMERSLLRHHVPGFAGGQVPRGESRGRPVVGETLVCLLNAGAEAVDFALPAFEPGLAWACIIDTFDPRRERRSFARGRRFRLADHSVAVFIGVAD
jgi:hypothetical protein